jgi:hypothetical protein
LHDRYRNRLDLVISVDAYLAGAVTKPVRPRSCSRSFFEKVSTGMSDRKVPVRKRRMASYLYLYDEGWDYVEAYSPRLLESVLLKPGEREHPVQDLERFRASRP